MSGRDIFRPDIESLLPDFVRCPAFISRPEIRSESFLSVPEKKQSDWVSGNKIDQPLILNARHEKKFISRTLFLT